MLKIESLDKKYRSLEEELKPLATWLLEELKKGRVNSKKRLSKEADFYLEVYLVNSKTLAKNVYAYEAPKGFPNPENSARPLGEIYINPDIAKSQDYSVDYMLVHGFLHLLGYEHETKNDTMAMEALEKDLLDQFN